MSTPYSAIKFGQKGQAAVEFTLLLVVTVALVLAFSAKIFRPMGNFTKAYMGPYLACLLDFGVLPRLGSGDDTCATSLDVADNPLAPRPGGFKKLAEEANKKSESKKANISPEQLEVRNSRSGNRNKVAINGVPTSGSRFSSTTSADGREQDPKSTEAPSSLPQSKFYSGSSASRSSAGRTIRVEGLSGLLSTERDRIKRRESKILKIGQLESEGQSGKGKVFILKPPQRITATEAPDEPWGFGKLIRFLIIAAIILAIILFLASQALQIAKAQEK